MLEVFPSEEGGSGPIVAFVPQSGDSAAFGESLRLARERRGLTLQQIAHATNIPAYRLEALEQGYLSAIPGDVYQRTEIRAFAQTVGLNQNLVLSEFERAVEATGAEAPLAATPQEAAPTHTSKLVLFALAVVLALTGLPSAGVPPTAPLSTFAAPVTSSATLNTPSLTYTARDVMLPVAAPDGGQETPRGQAPPPRLRVTTVPDGARVTVNGIGYGETPVTIRHLAPGEKRIRVTKAGFSAAERRVRLADRGSDPALRIVLRKR